MTILSNISSLQEKHVRRRQRRARPHVSVVDFMSFLCLWKIRNVVSARQVMCLRVTVPIHYASPQVNTTRECSCVRSGKEDAPDHKRESKKWTRPAGEMHGIKSEGAQRWRCTGWRCTGSTEETSNRHRRREVHRIYGGREGEERKGDESSYSSGTSTTVRFAFASTGVRAPHLHLREAHRIYIH